MDHRQTPCADSDFSGYSDKPAYAPVTGEHKIPWPPKTTLHRHPSDFAIWIIFALLFFVAVCAVLGFLAVVQWLF
jgi:hypothetical protein